MCIRDRDYRAFWVNTKLDGGIALNMLSSVFENRVTEWDGVMNNGIFYGYISWFLLLILLFMFLMKSQSRKYGISLALTIAILIAVCCRSTFLGWYLLPVSYTHLQGYTPSISIRFTLSAAINLENLIQLL